MEREGMPSNLHRKFFSGHSLGGAMLPDYIINEQVNSTTGIILLGAFLTRKYRTGNTTNGTPQVVFPVPSLTIGSSLFIIIIITIIIVHHYYHHYYNNIIVYHYYHHIGGELDGLCRITRITEALHTQVSMSQSQSLAMQYMPVTVIEGMNHMQFASGIISAIINAIIIIVIIVHYHNYNHYRSATNVCQR